VAPRAHVQFAAMISPTSVHVFQRLCLKLLLILIFAHLDGATEWREALAQLAFLTAGGCVLLACFRQERPRRDTLNYWDEACCFSLIACIL
jgi:formate hydrogenlyase subunit 3/multisubunit Na+/H+ antiporter MnhD subunit